MPLWFLCFTMIMKQVIVGSSPAIWTLTTVVCTLYSYSNCWIDSAASQSDQQCFHLSFLSSQKVMKKRSMKNRSYRRILRLKSWWDRWLQDLHHLLDIVGDAVGGCVTVPLLWQMATSCLAKWNLLSRMMPYFSLKLLLRSCLLIQLVRFFWIFFIFTLAVRKL